MKVKVCGITSYEDAALALDLGADALGFNFFPPSPRFVSLEAARAIIRRLPPFVTRVAVVVNEPDAGKFADAARAAGITALQLHGDETPEYCRTLADWILIKALRVGNEPVSVPVAEFPVDAFLLDAKDDRLYGGTGRVFDWSLAGNVNLLRPVILAGGLKPENVREGILAVKPYAVDVCSGVESVPGKKDRERLQAFMNEVRKCE
jgi:phosphoribosylanthranilate isomerase